MAKDLKYGKVTFEKPTTIAEDEPVVVFRARDKLLLDVLAYYRNKCIANGSPQGHVDLIHQTEESVYAWQMKNETQVPASKSYKPE